MKTKRSQKYALTEEHKAQSAPWAKKWIDNARRTRPMDDIDREIMRKAIIGMYEAANLKAPRIVFVASPFIATFATGFASAIWYKRAAIDDATYAATDDATSAATRKVTGLDRWYVVPTPDTELANELGCGLFGFECAGASYTMRNGGNQWAGWAAFLSFFRHIVKLDIDYSKWDHYEQAAVHGGPRYLHKEFCIVSDFPTVLKVDEQNRPHCEDGPFCKWSDGSALYSWHGVRVPAKWIERKHELTAKIALTWENLEERRAACEIVGWAKILKELNAKVIDEDHPRIGTLLEVDLPDSGKEKFLRVECATGREFALPVAPEATSAIAANLDTYGIDFDKLNQAQKTKWREAMINKRT